MARLLAAEAYQGLGDEWTNGAALDRDVYFLWQLWQVEGEGSCLRGDPNRAAACKTLDDMLIFESVENFVSHEREVVARHHTAP